MESSTFFPALFEVLKVRKRWGFGADIRGETEVFSKDFRVVTAVAERMWR